MSDLNSPIRTGEKLRRSSLNQSPLPAVPAVPTSLSIEEIESLVKMARSNLALPTNDEELGPGDLQHLRGETVTPSATPLDGWLSANGESELPMNSIGRPTPTAQESAENAASSTSAATLPFVTAAVPSAVHSSTSQGLTLEDLGDVELDVTIELGRSELMIEDILKLREGSVVSLDKLAGDSVEILANGRLIARGELLVVGGKFGVRLMEVL